MTEQKDYPLVTESETSTDATNDATTDATDTASPVQKKNHRDGLSISLSLLALLVALGSGALYLWGNQRLAQQQQATAQLSSQLDALQQQRQQQADLQADLQRNLRQTVRQQQQDNQALQQQNAALSHQLERLRQRMAMISPADANNWLLAQANFLVNMAGRKLWSDQDTLTALALLKSADASLAEMRDPALLSARRAINADMATLAAINQVDYDGLILQVNQLASQVDNLRLADDISNGEPMDSDSRTLTSSLRQWRQNLAASWQSFLHSFITIRRRDSSAEPLLAPNQAIYLRENIRASLLTAAQAVPRHQQQTWRQSLEAVASWVRAYYNNDDAATKAFLDSVDQLSQQNINMDLPQSLQSQPILQRLIQSRLRGIPANTEASPPPTAKPAGAESVITKPDTRPATKPDAKPDTKPAIKPDTKLSTDPAAGKPSATTAPAKESSAPAKESSAPTKEPSAPTTEPSAPTTESPTPTTAPPAPAIKTPDSAPEQQPNPEAVTFAPQTLAAAGSAHMEQGVL